MSRKFILPALGLVALSVLFNSSCLRAQRAHHQRALALKAESEADLAQAQAEAIRGGQLEEEEYLEGEALPETPAPLADEVTPAPSTVHVWIGGCHVRRGGHWVWVPGHWALPPHVGAVWMSGHWVRRSQGFVWVPGSWR